MTGRQGIGCRDGRGQLVLLAGVVVALALVAMLAAYLQLGYHADVATSEVDDGTVRDGQSYLQRATHAVARDLRGEYNWSRRDEAVAAMRDRLRPERRTLERSRVESGVVFEASLNQSAARSWAVDNCPGGPGREFGTCQASRGIVVQNRSDRALVVAVGYDLAVTTDDQRTELTLVVEPTE